MRSVSLTRSICLTVPAGKTAGAMDKAGALTRQLKIPRGYVQVNIIIIPRMTGSKYRSHNLHRTLRQRTHEGPSVWFRHDSIVENHDNAAITFGANKAADSLTQFQDRFRQRVFREGVATARFDIFEFRLH